MEKKNIFVVGGSSGIGLELVQKLNEDRQKFLWDPEPGNLWLNL